MTEQLQAAAWPTPIGGSRPEMVRRIGTQTLYLVLGNLFTLVVGWPLQIYVSRILGPSGIGTYGVLESATTMAAALLGLGLAHTAIRFVPAYVMNRDYANAAGLIRLSLAMLLAIGGGAYLVLLFSTGSVRTLWPSLQGYEREIALMGLLTPLGMVCFFLQQSLRGFQAIGQLTIGSSVLQLTVKALLTVALLAAGWALDGYIIATVCATVCGVVWLGGCVLRQLRAMPYAPPTRSLLPEWRRYAAICYADNVFAAVTTGLDRFIIGALLGSGAVGVLMIAQQLQRLPERFNQILLLVGSPMFAAAHAGNDPEVRQHLYNLTTNWVVAVALPLLLFLFLFAPQVLGLFGTDFAAQGALPLQILVVGQFFNLMCGPIGAITMMSGLERQSVILNIVSMAIFAALLLVLSSWYGIIGAAVAAVSNTLLLNIGLMVIVRSRLRLRWWSSRYFVWARQAAASLAVGSLVPFVLSPMRPVQLIVILICMYLAAAGATFFGGLHEDDRQLLQHLRNKITGWLLPA